MVGLRIEVPGAAGSESRFVRMLDVDADGQPDLALVGRLGRLEWHRNRGAGRFDAPREMAAPGLGSISDLHAGDLDADGDLDAVGASRTGALGWARNDGGRFAPVEWVAPEWAGGINALAASDLDRDGRLDLVLLQRWKPCDVCVGHGRVTWRRNLDGGRFAAADTLVRAASEVVRWAIGDLDGDGRDDVLLAEEYPKRLVAHLSREAPLATPTLLPDLERTRFDPYTENLIVADWDGDGDLDLLVSSGRTAWVERRSDGWAPAVPIDALGDGALATGDLDGDGDLDLVQVTRAHPSADAPAARVFWYEQGGGAWASPRVLAAGAARWPVALVDGDDGGLDVVGYVWQRPHESALTLWPGQGGTPRPLLPAPVSPLGLLLPLDADRDGQTDLLAVNDGTVTPNGANASLFLRSDGGFVRRPFPATGSVFSPTVGDVDGDGWTDLVAKAHTRGVVWWRNAEGTWEDTPREIAARSYAVEQIVVRDATGDGRPDVLIGYADVPVLMRARADGGWDEMPIPAPPRQSRRAYHIGAPAEGSQRTEVVIAAPVPLPDSPRTRQAAAAGMPPVPSDSVVVAGYWRVNDAYRMSVEPYRDLPCWIRTPDPTGSLPPVAFADVDADGWDDAVAVSAEPRPAGVVVCYGRPYGRFMAAQPLVPWLGDARWVQMADIDGDGDLDLVAAVGEHVLWSEQRW